MEVFRVLSRTTRPDGSVVEYATDPMLHDRATKWATLVNANSLDTSAEVVTETQYRQVLATYADPTL